jgi:FtsZ-binding cell division protein ZapB
MFKQMRPLILFLCLSAFCCTNSSAQSFDVDVTYTTNIPDDEKKLIFYKPGQLLSISDFTASPVAGNEAVAITSSGFAFKAGYRNEAGKSTLIITVFCSFDKQQSWMKTTGKTPYILSHEQSHFDISYIAAKAFISKLKAASFTQQNYKNLLQSIYAEVSENLERMQQQYDSETSNGQLKDNQANWSKKISALIAKSA